MTAPTDPEAVSLPPLLRGRSLAVGIDPLRAGAEAGAAGEDPGLVLWSRDTARLRAAILLAPEEALERATGGAVFAVALGFADGFGALAPPETAVHFDWPAGIRVNGATAGRVRAAAASRDPGKVPDWLAAGIEVALLPVGAVEPGATPEATTLLEEGCGDLGAARLAEVWARHTLVWINRLLDDGLRPLHEAWRGHFDRIGTTVSLPEPGRVLGLDETGGLLLAVAEGGSKLHPLTLILEDLP